MNLARLTRKFGQAISPVRISVSRSNAVFAESGTDNSPNHSAWATSERLSASGHMLEIEFVERTDVGRVRDHNEDFLGYAAPETPAHARSHGWLFALADGVGGGEKGEVA